jgi:hypothetical protein
MKTYSAWTNTDGDQVTFVEGHDRPRGLNGKFMPGADIHLWSLEAQTWEEAQAIKHLRLGFEPYKPSGEAQPCPKCEAFYYPKGSGECWRCGKIN